jgi:hypothetical protein
VRRHPAVRSARRLGTALAAATTVGLAAAAGAQAATPAQSAVAQDVTSGPFHLSFTAHRDAEAPQNAATGTFDAVTRVGSLGLMDLHGPITCLNVRGNRVGLFYPITSALPSLLAKIGSGILIYLSVDGKGHATGVQFVPVPLTRVRTCAPTLPSLLPATGSATLGS